MQPPTSPQPPTPQPPQYGGYPPVSPQTGQPGQYPPSAPPPQYPPQPGYMPYQQPVPPLQPGMRQPAMSTGAARPQRYDALPLPIRMVEWAKRNWWAPLVGVLILVLAGDIAFQMAYPSQALPPGVKIDGLSVGRASKNDIINTLNTEYAKVPVEIYFGEATVPYKTPTAKEVGIGVDNSDRLRHASYPLWLRLVPTSYWWAGALVSVGKPTYVYDKVALDKYTLRHIGKDCRIAPKNPTLALDDGRFTVVKSVAGGVCDVNDFTRIMQSATVGDNGKIVVRTPMKETGAPISNESAQGLADSLNTVLGRDFELKAPGVAVTVPGLTIKNWLTFKEVIPEDTTKQSPRLEPVVDAGRVKTYFAQSLSAKLEKKPGVTKIATKDFTVLSETRGANGVGIDIDAALASIQQVVAGKSTVITVTTKELGPTVEYTRSYSPTEEGFRALITQFASDNPGTNGIVLEEFSGKKPFAVAAANDKAVLPAHGLEGLYVAYAAQVGIENGSLQPTVQISGSASVLECMKRAVEDQDTECTQALLLHIGNAVVQERLRAIGLTSTSLSGERPTTTARDMHTFIYKFAKKELPVKRLSDIDTAMRNVQARDGFLRQVSNAVSAAGVGETGYAELALVRVRGMYTLSYLSDNKNPETAKKLVAAIEKLRAEKQAQKN